VDVVLQRPDFHVFGCARNAGGADRLVDALRLALRGGGAS